MKVIEVRKIDAPDNSNHAPGVVPMPMQTFEAKISWEQSQEIKRLIEEAREQ